MINNDLTQKLQFAQNTNVVIEKEKERLQTANQKPQQQIKALSAQVAEKAKENNNLQGRIQTSERKLQANNTKIQELKNKVGELESYQSTLEENTKLLTKSLEDANKTTQNSMADTNNLRKESKSQELKIKSLVKQMEENKVSLSQARLENKRLQENDQLLRQQLQNTRQASSLRWEQEQATIASQKEQIVKYQGHIGSLNQKITGLEQEIKLDGQDSTADHKAADKLSTEVALTGIDTPSPKTEHTNILLIIISHQQRYVFRAVLV